MIGVGSTRLGPHQPPEGYRIITDEQDFTMAGDLCWMLAGPLAWGHVEEVGAPVSDFVAVARKITP